MAHIRVLLTFIFSLESGEMSRNGNKPIQTLLKIMTMIKRIIDQNDVKVLFDQF